MMKKTYLVWLAALGLTACGGSGSNSDASSSSSASASESSDSVTRDVGTLQLAITDAEEDFLSYQVDLLSATLVREDGTEVDLVSTTTEVDFVEYQSLSELFMVTSVPVGSYSQILLNLDYSNSEIIIQDEESNSYTASAVDTDGETIGSFQVEVQLSDDAELDVRKGGIYGLTLDLDLAASNTILSFDPAVVEVSPLLMVSAATDAEREHRARGQLSSVDEEAEQFIIGLLPMRRYEGDYGDLTVQVGEETLYEVDGEDVASASGLAALAALEVDSSIVVYGSTDSDTGVFAASQVIAGSGADWSQQDFVKGVVTARSDNTLTLSAVLISRRHQEVTFSDAVTVAIDETTSVTGHPTGDVDISAISVGQKVEVAGTYTTDVVPVEVIDATEGLVRLKQTQVVGTLNAASPASLALLSINNLDVGQFDFSGTGASEAEDADPTDYQLDTGVLDLSNLTAEDWVASKGYMVAFGSAPEDFDAYSVSEVSFANQASYLAYWTAEDAAAIAIDGSEISLDLTSAVAELKVKGVPYSLMETLEVTSFTASDDEGRFAIHIPGENATMYESYAAFLTDLAVLLSEGDMLTQFTAKGALDTESGQLDMERLVVRFGDIGEARETYGRGHGGRGHSDSGGRGGSHGHGNGHH